jgi:hypothetical protein
LTCDPKKLLASFGVTVIDSTPNTINNMAVAANALPKTPSVEQSAKYSDFNVCLNAVFDLFESHPFDASEISSMETRRHKLIATALAAGRDLVANSEGSEGVGDVKSKAKGKGKNNNKKKSSNEKSSSSDGGEKKYFSSKYGTSASSFPLQKRDPNFRMEVLTQIIVFVHDIRGKLRIASELIGNCPPLANTISTSKGGRSREGGGSKAAAAAVAPFAAQLTYIDTLAEDMKVIKGKAYVLLTKTPPDGLEYVEVLRTILKRERSWVSWKLGGCGDFEIPNQRKEDADNSVKAELLESKNPFATAEAKGKKRKLFGEQATDHKPKKYLCDITPEYVAETARKLVEEVPSYEDHIGLFIEAEDPANGIEEDYHPKHDGVYCWRARRLLAAKKLSVFEKMIDGNLSNGVKEFMKDKEPQEGAGAGAEAEESEEARRARAFFGDDF